MNVLTKPPQPTISAEKTKLMTKNTSGINTEIKVNGQKIETVTSFRFLGSVITDEGPKPEILSRIARTTAAFTRLKLVWNDRSTSPSTKINKQREEQTLRRVTFKCKITKIMCLKYTPVTESILC